MRKHANNKGADQPAHSRGLISCFVVGCLDSIIPILVKSEISRLTRASLGSWFESYLVADPEGRFSCDVSLFFFLLFFFMHHDEIMEPVQYLFTLTLTYEYDISIDIKI